MAEQILDGSRTSRPLIGRWAAARTEYRRVAKLIAEIEYPGVS
jgi:hypothetical protein